MAAFCRQLLAKRRVHAYDRSVLCSFTSELQHVTTAHLIWLFEEYCQDLCTGAWNWQEEGCVNPNGYGDISYMFTDDDSLFARWLSKREGGT